METENSEIITYLTGARDLCQQGWRQFGYIKRIYGDPKVAECVIGALYAVKSSDFPLLKKTVRCFNEANQIAKPGESDKDHAALLFKWNDDPNRTWPEVIEAFNKAIRHVEILDTFQSATEFSEDRAHRLGLEGG